MVMPGEIQPPKRRGGLLQVLVSVIIIFAILWITAFFAVRTRTGHDAVVERLQRGLGRELTVGTTRLAPPLALVAEQVVSVDYVAGEQGVRADLIEVSFGFRPWVRVHVVRPEVNLVYDGVGWTPARLAGLGELPGDSLGGLSELCTQGLGNAAMTVEDGTINWYGGRTKADRHFTEGNGDDGGGRAAFAEHVNFKRCRVALPQREAWFHGLEVARVQTPDAPVVEGVKVEWLSVESNRYVEITRSSSLPPADAAGFWGAGQ